MSGTTQGQPHSKPFTPTGTSDASPDMMYNTGTAAMEKAVNRMRNREWKHRFSVPYMRATVHARGYSAVIMLTVGGTAVLVAMPFLYQQYTEILGLDIPLHDAARVMPPHTPAWWLNEWRKQLTPWRYGESWLETSPFYLRTFEFLAHCTGRDMLHPPVDQVTRKDGTAVAKHRRAFVPMCGDSPIVRVLASAGYEVDAIDTADIAIRELSQRLDTHFAAVPEVAQRVNLHLQDIFAPHAWKAESGIINSTGAFDFIWDRQGITAVDPNMREDYAFLLKRALKPDGVIYVEGTMRTAKRKRNRNIGPPFHFGEEELAPLFPRAQGFRVKCDELRELTLNDLDAEARVTGIIPEHLLGRHFPCAVWRDPKLLSEMSMAL